jgi:hypothetical protein
MPKQTEVLELRAKIDALEKELDDARKDFDKKKKECNHTYSNGKSAWISGYFESHCDICFNGDMGL